MEKTTTLPLYRSISNYIRILQNEKFLSTPKILGFCSIQENIMKKTDIIRYDL